MDSEDAFLLLAGAIVGGLAVYMLLFRRQTYSQPQRYCQPQINTKPETNVYRPVAVNKETWEWTDWKGRHRTITVHREVKQLG